MNLTALDHEVATALAAAPPQMPLTHDNLAVRRAEFNQPVSTNLSAAVERIDHQTRPGGLVLRVHRPIGLPGPLPCLYWLHGGGTVMGNRFQDDLRFDVWCHRHGMIAVTVEYRLAPESPYPGPLDDCVAGLRWVVARAAELDIDPARIGVGGASAGGGLAAALTLVNRERNIAPLAFQLLVYPMLDDRLQTSSSQADVPVWPPTENKYAWACYLSGRAGADVHEHAAPARGTDLRCLPRAYVCVGTNDGFLDEDVEYALRLAHAGVSVDVRIHAGLPHGYDAVASGTAAVKRANRDLNEWLGRALHGSAGP